MNARLFFALWFGLCALGCGTGSTDVAAPAPKSPEPTPSAEALPDQPALVAEALRWLDTWAAPQGRVSLGQVRTWLDGTNGLAPRACEITFVQSFSSGARREYGRKRLLVLRQGAGDFRIVEEQMIERAERMSFSGLPQEPFLVTVRAPATALELHVSDARETDEGARVSRTLLTVRAPAAATSLHLESDLALGEPNLEDDGTVTLSSSLHAGRLVMFRLQRTGETLMVAKRHGDESDEEPEPWAPYARVALGSATPVPLLCAGASLRPCLSQRSAL